MKKVIGLIVLCGLLLSLAACGAPQFESQETMFAQLNGMWIDETTGKYYIFQDGNAYTLFDSSFTYALESHFSSVLREKGIDALVQLDLQTALNGMGVEKILGSTSDLQADPKKGTMILDPGAYIEEHISVRPEGVTVKEASEETASPLSKIANSTDFSGKHFAELFAEAKENYRISTDQFWADTKEYGAMVKAFNSEIDGWELTTQNETTTIYESNKWVPDISSSLVITDNLVSFSREVSLLNKWTDGIDFNPTFKVLYTPGNSVIIQDIDNMSLNMGLLIQYAANAFRKFPGSLDHIEVDNLIAKEFEKGNHTTEDGWAKVEIKVNGITYKVMQGTNGTKGYVFASADETIKLSDIMDSMQTAPEETQPEQTETTEPAVTEPVQTIPMNDVPYTTSLGAAVSIFDGPSYDYTYVQSVGQDGIYTIVEEAYDSEGNLWGKLKSGLGWVDLSSTKDGQLSGSPISANFAPVSVLSSDHHEVILDNSEYMVKVAFWAHDNLSNVQFSSLQFDDNSYQVAEILYALPELTPDKPLVVGVSFPGPASIFGISFTDSSGATRCYAVFTSGRNGELVLEEYN